MTHLKYPTYEKELNNLLSAHPKESMLINMDPKDFLSYVPSNGLDDYRIQDLSKKIEHGTQIDPLYLKVDTSNCSVTEHEGRHRAAASIELGIDSVPVVVIFKNETADKQKCCIKNKCNLSLKEIDVHPLLHESEKLSESIDEMCGLHDSDVCKLSGEIEYTIEDELLSETRSYHNNPSYIKRHELKDINNTLKNIKDGIIHNKNYAEELLSATEHSEHQYNATKTAWDILMKHP